MSAQAIFKAVRLVGTNVSHLGLNGLLLDRNQHIAQYFLLRSTKQTSTGTKTMMSHRQQHQPSITSITLFRSRNHQRCRSFGLPLIENSETNDVEIASSRLLGDCSDLEDGITVAVDYPDDNTFIGDLLHNNKIKYDLLSSVFHSGNILVSVNDVQCCGQPIERIHSLFDDTLFVESGWMTITIRRRKGGNMALKQAILLKPLSHDDFREEAGGAILLSDLIQGVHFTSSEISLVGGDSDDNDDIPPPALCVQLDDVSSSLWLRHSCLSKGDVLHSINNNEESQCQDPQYNTTVLRQKSLRDDSSCPSCVIMQVFRDPSDKTAEETDDSSPQQQQHPKSQLWRRIRKGAVAAGGGTLVGVGAVLMVTPLHPIGHVLALGGTGVLSTEFEAPKRALSSGRDRLASISSNFRRSLDAKRKPAKDKNDDELLGEQAVETTQDVITEQKKTMTRSMTNLLRKI
jgi:hypothetical protein